MAKKFALLIGCVGALVAPSAAFAETAAYHLNLTVGVSCTVRHQLSGFGQQNGEAVSLGQIREACNAQNGYALVVNYTPGTLRGTVLKAGDDQIVLDGSGQAILARVSGPRIRERTVTATPGKNGFDSPGLRFSLIAA